MKLMQSEYNMAIYTLQNLLGKPSKLGSDEDVAIFRAAHLIEDYEMSKRDVSTFEPYYIEEPK